MTVFATDTAGLKTGATFRVMLNGPAPAPQPEPPPTPPPPAPPSAPIPLPVPAPDREVPLLPERITRKQRLRAPSRAHRGVIFDDADLNGRRSRREDGIGGVTVFLDLNRNGFPDTGEPSTLSAPDGDYELTGDRSAARSVGVIVPTGMRFSRLPAAPRTYSLSAAPRLFKAGPIGLTSQAVFGGEIYVDVNGNGIREADDPKAPRTRVFLDANGDGVWQSDTERSTTTDRRGRFTFTGVAPGPYRLGFVPSRGFAPVTRNWPGGVLEWSVVQGGTSYGAIGIMPSR
jgi:hypothetical protein